MNLEDENNNILDNTASAANAQADANSHSNTSYTANQPFSRNTVDTVSLDHIKVDRNIIIASEPSCWTSESSIDSTVYKVREFTIEVEETTDNCQYVRLNMLTLQPELPWIDDLLWKEVALIIRPKLAFEGFDSNARTTVIEMLSHIKQGDKQAKQLPIYQWIDSSFELNQNNTAFIEIVSIQQRSELIPKLYYQRAIMLDMTKMNPLKLTEVLLPDSRTTAELLSMIQHTSKRWNATVETDIFPEGWPFHLAQQWYLSDQGLHLLYQPGEIVSGAIPQVDNYNSHIIDIFVPHQIIDKFLRPRYKVTHTLPIDDVTKPIEVTLRPINANVYNETKLNTTVIEN